MEDVLNGIAGCRDVSGTSECAIQDKLLRPVISSLQTTISCELSVQIPSDCITADLLCECFCASIRHCGFQRSSRVAGLRSDKNSQKCHEILALFAGVRNCYTVVSLLALAFFHVLRVSIVGSVQLTSMERAYTNSLWDCSSSVHFHLEPSLVAAPS